MAYVAVIVLAIYTAYSIISDNIAISEYNEKYKDLAEKTETVLESNAEISRYLEDDANLDEYIEDMAREKLDFANPDERIYYIVPSSGD
jgi:cell division protein FtsB